MKTPEEVQMDDILNAPLMELPPSVDEEIRSAEVALAALLNGPIAEIPDYVESDGDSNAPPSPPTPLVAAPHPGRGPSPSITIRMPQHIIDAYRLEAAKRGLKYQELMKLVLQTASSSWW